MDGSVGNAVFWTLLALLSAALIGAVRYRWCRMALAQLLAFASWFALGSDLAAPTLEPAMRLAVAAGAILGTAYALAEGLLLSGAIRLQGVEGDPPQQRLDQAAEQQQADREQ